MNDLIDQMTEWDEIIDISSVQNEDVYDLNVNIVHNFFANDLLVHNCGEITLSPYDSCRLLLVNLAKFVKNPFTSEAKFDFDRFNDTVKKAQKLMDDLIDLEIEAVERIITKINNDPEPLDVKDPELKLWNKILTVARNGRRTGLGITALGDAIAFLNVRYGSDESVGLTGELYKALSLGAYRSTVEMARDRGTFSVFSHEIEKGHPFIEQVLSEDPTLRAEYEKYGRRNIALTTTAPAGSVSILTQTTSGCEPAFLLGYKRRRKINPNDFEARVDFVDPLGDKWQEYMVYHHGFKKWMDITGKAFEQAGESPYAGATSNEIDWVKKVDMQAAAQKWICHSISNTTNIPNQTTVDVVKDIYMRGWETGCKGVTIYRDGSRTGVLVADEPKKEVEKDDEQPEKILENHAPKRPKELICDIHRVNVKGESYLVLVGMLNGTPYEVFAGLSEHVEVPKKAKTGILIKNGKKEGVATYNLRIPVGDDDSIVFKDVVELFSNKVYGAFTRTISLALRHGVPVQYLVEQLRKDKNSDITSFSNVIARVLSKGYIPDGTKATIEKTCGDCGSTNLAYQSGCVTCMNCGSSKCS
jgi:ribonucleoside-diphosphate reductase alpha chain